MSKTNTVFLLITISISIFACTDYEKRPDSGNIQVAKPSSVESETSEASRISGENAKPDQAAPIEKNPQAIKESEQAVEDEAALSTTPLKPAVEEIVTLESGNEGYVEWQPPTKVSYSSADVVVIGPDGVRKQYRFQAGEPMVVNENLPDGLYQWESVVTPEISENVKKELGEARQTGDFEAQERLMEKYRQQGLIPHEQQASNNRQSGGFVVRDGVATPTTIEVVDEGDVE